MGPPTPTKAQRAALDLIASGGVYRWERNASSYVTTPDGALFPR